MAVPNAIRITETADATNAPATTGVHCKKGGGTVSTGTAVTRCEVSTGLILFDAAASAEAEESENGHDDHDQAD
jgi:hypothetical protein